MNKRTFFQCIAGVIAATVGVAQAKSWYTRARGEIEAQLDAADRATRAALRAQQESLDVQLLDIRGEQKANECGLLNKSFGHQYAQINRAQR